MFPPAAIIYPKFQFIPSSFHFHGCRHQQRRIQMILHFSWRGIQANPKDSFVMPTMVGKESGGKQGLSEAFKRIAGRAGLDVQEVQGGGARKICRRSFHSLRHSFASALANAGVSPEVRMKLTGHTTEAAHKTYTHHDMETLRAALSKVATIGENS